MLDSVRRIRSQSKVRKIDLYTRVGSYVVPWFFLLPQGALLLKDAPAEGGARLLAWLLCGLGAAVCLTGIPLLSRAFDRYLGRDVAFRWWPAVVGVLLLATLATSVALTSVEHGAKTVGAQMLLGMGIAMIPVGSYCLVVRKRVFALSAVAGGALLAVPYWPAGVPFSGLLAIGVVSLFICGWVMSVVRVSGWMLGIVWEVDAARAVQARLAVAEERLRFGRDMHDVLGRNLAVIALKSELAVRLAERDPARALEQMTEVQRMAQDSQRELREVVRGYREADLHTELVGARGVLSAAGTECLIDDIAGEELPAAVQSVLAWVVREGTTNVLRHADARRCSMRLRISRGQVVLTIENDGLRDGTAGGGGGSGLAGLRERLTTLGGTLTDGPGGGKGTFRLTAKVPLTETGTETDAEAEAGAETRAEARAGTAAPVPAPVAVTAGDAGRTTGGNA
ncbi:sensor histidine kinase [Streptomyces mashuensis]|uniref:sensor histidine kinase n=1 Tax=Streptomyces mashuensis TaxID=33904 RepID=UPI001E64866D|nr:histidine kinase [Streptomyces mashuensis]